MDMVRGEGYTLICGDCLKILPTLSAASVDLNLADLPFGTTSNSWDSVIPVDDLWRQLRRVAKERTPLIFFAVQPFTSLLVSSNLKCYKHRWIWDKRLAGNFALVRVMPLTIDEDILVFSPIPGLGVNYYPIMRKGEIHNRGGKHSTKTGRGFGGLKNVYYDSDEFYPTSILQYPAVTRSESLHPSQKPVELLEYLIETYTKPGDTVLDPTMGSGSTGVAALRKGRKFIGMETSVEYFHIAAKRLEDAARATAKLPKQLSGRTSDYADSPLFNLETT